MIVDARAYWNAGVANVPWKTGASAVMDCRDLVEACTLLGLRLPLSGITLDVGCGTGRWRAHCEQYFGCDIAADAVAYATQQGVPAMLIDGPTTLPDGPFDWVCCFSVFTHIGRADRQAYLHAFATRARRLIVDVIPGAEGGTIALWSAAWEDVLADLHAAGWLTTGAYVDRISPDGQRHRYFTARRTPS